MSVRAVRAGHDHVGFAGLGRIGAAMFESVVEAGFSASAYDLRPEAVQVFLDGPHDVVAATSPAEVASRSAVVDVVVNTDRQVLDVCLGAEGILAGSRPGTVVLLHSTISLETLRTVATAGHEVGVHVLDAPVSGRYGHRSVGDLCVMVGGEPGAFERARPVPVSYTHLTLPTKA